VALGARGRGRDRQRETIETTALPTVLGQDDQVLSAEKAVGKSFFGRFEGAAVGERKHRTAPATDRYIRAR
jgi:hypothetical protein